jgi:outer membrane biosynthesis protein TonB
MAGTGEKPDSLRLNRFEMKRLVWALVLSLAAHFLVWGGYELGKKYDLWQRLHWPERLHQAQKKAPPPAVQETEPTMFLDVDPDQVSPDAPKNAKYYSAKNSRAANPEANRDLKQPKLNGKQTDVPQVRDVPRTPIIKPQPAPEPPSPQKEEQTPPSKPAEQGEIKLAKLETAPEKTETPEKPRTLKEARAQQQNLRPSIAMQQDGGTPQHALVPSFDSKATPFGEYDSQVFDAIQQYWNDELYSQKFALDRKGRVTLRFHLNYDGSISDMEVLRSDVGELYSYVCQQAVTGSAPYAKWPSDMRRMIGENYRQVTLTFIYY